MSRLCLGLCFDCYYVAVLYAHVFERLKWYCLSLLVHCCLLTFLVILEERRQAGPTSRHLCIFIGSVPGLWVLKEKLL